MSGVSVRVAIDFASPAAYLAIEPTRALESRLGRSFEWLPTSVPPLQKHDPATPGDERGARHRRIRAEYVASDLRRYAEARGIELGDVHRAPDTATAAFGLLWLRRRAPELASEYTTRVFDRIWRENAAADVRFVEKALGREAADFADYTASEGPGDLAAVRAELEALAVWNVPAFLVGDELFIGRQHLPMVEWLATGQTTAPPI